MVTSICLDYLALEVTTLCDLDCKDCTRKKVARYMSTRIAELAIHDINFIEHLAFTGGEPSLNLPILNYIQNYCAKWDVDVHGFSVKTNGMSVDPDFIACAAKWYAYCMQCGGEPENCHVLMRRGDSEKELPGEKKAMLYGLRFSDDEYGDHDCLPDASPLKELPENEKFCFSKGENVLVVFTPIFVSYNGDVLANGGPSTKTKGIFLGNLRKKSLRDILMEAAEKADS